MVRGRIEQTGGRRLISSDRIETAVVVFHLLGFIVFVFFIVLILRMVFDWVQMFSRDWRPRGPLLFAAETIYSTTDPPLKWLRRVIPPLRIGGVQLDLAFMVLFLIVVILLSVLGG
jgi:YggT family protein